LPGLFHCWRGEQGRVQVRSCEGVNNKGMREELEGSMVQGREGTC
jgi:hypothetical protein